MSPQVQSPWGRKPTARSEECQGGPCGWRRARGKEENREGTRRGGQRCVAAGLEDSAVPSEMEQGEVSTGQACQDLDSNKITAWGPGKSSGEAREAGDTNRGWWWDPLGLNAVRTDGQNQAWQALQSASGVSYTLRGRAEFVSASVVLSVNHVQLFVTPWTAAGQASLYFTVSWSLLRLMSVKSVMPSDHLILCHLLLLLPSIFPSIRVRSLHQMAKGLELQLQHQPFQ